MIESGRLQRVFTVLRHLFAIVALPGTVIVLVPLWIIDCYQVRLSWPRSANDFALALLGCGLLVVAAARYSSPHSDASLMMDGERSHRGTHRADSLFKDRIVTCEIR